MYVRGGKNKKVIIHRQRKKDSHIGSDQNTCIEENVKQYIREGKDNQVCAWGKTSKQYLIHLNGCISVDLMTIL